jgi:hypothetical protein
MLAGGQITPNLIAPSKMRKALDNIADKLKLQYPEYKLSYPISGSWYDLKSMLYTRTKQSVYILQHFPITLRSRGAIYQLYKIKSYSLPINKGNDHSSRIINIPAYIAVNSDDSCYIEITQDQYNECEGHYRKTCQYLNYPISQKQTTCALALYKNNLEAIQTLCDVRFQPNSLQKFVQELHDGAFIISNASSIIVTCLRLHVQKFPGCCLCLHTLQCHCSLLVDDITVHPRINNCDPATHTTVTNAINTTHTFSTQTQLKIFPTIQILTARS